MIENYHVATGIRQNCRMRIFDLLKSTNYFNTFIGVAEDCPVTEASVPPQKGDKPTVAGMQFDMISKHPYRYTSDDVVFGVHAEKSGTGTGKAEREQFFSKGQPCLRCSPLAKRYGWGIHSDEKGRVALYAVESPEYRKLVSDASLQHVKAMRTSRK